MFVASNRYAHFVYCVGHPKHYASAESTPQIHHQLRASFGSRAASSTPVRSPKARVPAPADVLDPGNVGAVVGPGHRGRETSSVGPRTFRTLWGESNFETVENSGASAL